MKRYLTYVVVALTTFSTNLFAQSEDYYENLSCGTEITQQQLDYLNKTERQRSAFDYKGAAKSTIFVPVQNHVARRSNGTGGLSTTDLTNIMITMNHYYGTVNIEFYECGPVNYIDDDAYFDFQSSDEGTLASGNDVTDVINIYYFNSVRSGSSAVCGYSRFPPSPDRVIMDNSCALNGSTIVHEIGHYFSLYHTHGKTNTGTTDELVNGNNCNTAGDNVCDTPADPNLSGRVSSSCDYTGSVLDANGQTFNPQTSNIMSYSRKACRRVFTPGQYSRALFSLQNDRSYLTCNAPAPAADFVSNSIISCRGDINFQDISSSLPNSWLWDFGDGSSSTLRNPTHTYDSSGTYTVSLVVTNNNGTDTQTKTNYVSINLPASPVVSEPDSVCFNEPAQLDAAGFGTKNWYSDASLTNLIGTGSSITTPPITTTSTFYVQHVLPNAPQSAGPSANTIGVGANFNNNRHLVFDALKPFTLKSVEIYASGTKERTIELRNFLGLILQDTTIMVNDGKQTVNLNFDVPAETDLQLGISVTSDIDMYRNSTGVNFPYTVPGVLNIKTTSAGSSFYYFFYNWQIQEADCISAAVEVTVPLKNCAVGIAENNLNDLSIFPNPTEGIVRIESNNSVFTDVRVFSVVGKLIKNVEFNANNSTLDLTSQPKGIYFVRISNGNETVTRKVVMR